MSKPSKQLKLVVKAGRIKAIYDDALTALFDGAEVKVERASHVEPQFGLRSFVNGWYADMRPVDGPVMVGFNTRQEALDAEVRYINQHVLGV